MQKIITILLLLVTANAWGYNSPLFFQGTKAIFPPSIAELDLPNANVGGTSATLTLGGTYNNLFGTQKIQAIGSLALTNINSGGLLGGTPGGSYLWGVGGDSGGTAGLVAHGGGAASNQLMLRQTDGAFLGYGFDVNSTVAASGYDLIIQDKRAANSTKVAIQAGPTQGTTNLLEFQGPNSSAGAGAIIASVGPSGQITDTYYGAGAAVFDSTSALSSVSPGTSGNVLTSNGTTWTSAAPTATNNSYLLQNLGITSTVAGSAITFNVKQADGSTDPSTGASAVQIGMRKSVSSAGGYNIRSITSALSFSLASGTTLGMLSAQNNYLWLYAIDSDGAGTMKLGASSILYDEKSVQSSVKESFTATVTIASPGVFTANGHGLNNSDAVRLTTTGSLPTGLSTGTTYYVVAASTNTFELATSPGGTAINTTGTQSGVHTVHIADSRLVSDGVYSNAPIRLIGRGTYNETVSGTWSSAASELSTVQLVNPAEKIAARYSTATQQTLTNATDVIINYDTMSYDTNGLVTTGSGWKWVAPKAGIVHVCAALGTASAVWTAGTAIVLGIDKNGSNYSYLQVNIIQANNTASMALSGCDDVSVVKGDYLQIYLNQNNGGSPQDVADSKRNWVDISYVN